MNNINISFFHGAYGEALAKQKAVNGAIVFDTVTECLYVNGLAFDLTPKMDSMRNELVAAINAEEAARKAADASVVTYVDNAIKSVVDGADDAFDTLLKIQEYLDGTYSYGQVDPSEIVILEELPEPTEDSPELVKVGDVFYDKKEEDGVYSYEVIPEKSPSQGDHPSSLDPKYVQDGENVYELSGAGAEINELLDEINANRAAIEALTVKLEPVAEDVSVLKEWKEGADSSMENLDERVTALEAATGTVDFISSDDTISITASLDPSTKKTTYDIVANIGSIGEPHEEVVIQGIATVEDVKEYIEKRFAWDEYDADYIASIISALENGGTVTVDRNLNVTETVIANSGETTVLNLDGCEVNATEDCGWYMFYAGNGTELTINGTNGSKVSANGTEHAIPVTADYDASVTINGGTFESEEGTQCVYVNRGGHVVINGGDYMPYGMEEATHVETLPIADAGHMVEMGGNLYTWNGSKYVHIDLLNIQNTQTQEQMQVKGGNFYGRDPKLGDDAVQPSNFVAPGFVSNVSGTHTTSAGAVVNIYTVTAQ